VIWDKILILPLIKKNGREYQGNEQGASEKEKRGEKKKKRHLHLSSRKKAYSPPSLLKGKKRRARCGGLHECSWKKGKIGAAEPLHARAKRPPDHLVVRRKKKTRKSLRGCRRRAKRKEKGRRSNQECSAKRGRQSTFTMAKKREGKKKGKERREYPGASFEAGRGGGKRRGGEGTS